MSEKTLLFLAQSANGKQETNQAASDAGTCPKWQREDSDVREIYLTGNAAASEVHSRYGKTH